MRRREFLIGTVAATGLTGATRLRAQAGGAKLARVGVCSRNFDAIVKIGVGPAPSPARTLDFLDFAQMVADRFGVHNLELQHSHFISTENAYLKDFRDRVAKAKSQILQIDTEFQGSNASAAGFSARAQAIDLAKTWIDHAEALGCPRVMVNPGSLAPDVRANAIEALKILAEYGKARKVTVTVENRDTGAMPVPPLRLRRRREPPARRPVRAAAVRAARARRLRLRPRGRSWPRSSNRPASPRRPTAARFRTTPSAPQV